MSRIPRRHGGTGLGLAISLGLAKMMGGALWATSDPETGSIFHLRITVEAVKESIDRTEEDESRGFEDRKVLLLSDHEPNRLILSDYTAHWGMDSCGIRGDNNELAQISASEVVDIAILDPRRETAQVIHLIDEIRKNRSDLPIIVFISLSNALLREKLSSYEALTVVHKPIKPSTLYNAIQKNLESSVSSERTPSSYSTDVNAWQPETNISILLVEDNAINQKVALFMLERLGLHPDLAVNGLESLNAVSRNEYDVVFMDVQMPEMDGLEATRLIRQDTSLESQPYIIALSAAAMKKEQELCAGAGMDDFIAKPVRLEELVAALERYFDSLT